METAQGPTPIPQLPCPIPYPCQRCRRSRLTSPSPPLCNVEQRKWEGSFSYVWWINRLRYEEMPRLQGGGLCHGCWWGVSSLDSPNPLKCQGCVSATTTGCHSASLPPPSEAPATAAAPATSNAMGPAGDRPRFLGCLEGEVLVGRTPFLQ